MPLVVCDMSTSLDGYVTGPRDSTDSPFGDGAEGLHDWLSTAATDEDRAILQQVLEDTGAIVMGRRSFDKNVGEGGWGEGGWGEEGPHGEVPCFVVTHDVPADSYPSVFTFVSDGVESAIERAKETAGERDVLLFGATVMQQALPLGLVDEVRLHVNAVLLGGGTSFFGPLQQAVKLQRVRVLATPAATHLTFRVIR